MANTEAEKAGLLTIPPELRLHIYDHYFNDFELTPLAGKKRTLIQPALLHTSQLVREEALPLYKKDLKKKIESARKEMDALDASQLEEHAKTRSIREREKITKRVLEQWGISYSRMSIYCRELKNIEAMEGDRDIE